jgi:hypothetical protein
VDHIEHEGRQLSQHPGLGDSAGDVAYLTPDGKTFVARPDGTQYEINAPGYNTVEYLFERGQTYDAAGERDYGFGRAVLWSGCAT